MVCFHEWNPHFVFSLALRAARTLSLIHPPFEKKYCGIHNIERDEKGALSSERESARSMQSKRKYKMWIPLMETDH
jgi:hypothetical protein